MTDEMLDKCRELLKKQADEREAGGGGKREPEIQATTTAVTPSAYHRDLAEAIFDDDMDSIADMAPDAAAMFRTCMRDEKIARIIAVLAEKGVVDPEDVERQIQDAIQASCSDYRQQLAALREKSAEAEQFLDDHTNHNNTTEVRDCIRLALSALREGDNDAT